MTTVVRIQDMSPAQLETYERVLHAVSLMRRLSMPLTAASREAGTTPESVRRFAMPALQRVSGRWVARSQDRLERRVLFYDRKGSYYVVVGSSTSASRISDYHRAMGSFLVDGDSSKLRGFAGKYVVDVHGRRHYFLTDPATIRPLARAGQMRGFDSIY